MAITPPSRLGILLVVSGPSGSGKTTLCRQLRDRQGCVYAVSCTTRAPRPGEQDGVDYHFLTESEFERRATRGEFLEHASVHNHHYGTLRSEVRRHLEHGVDVIIDIDTRGAALIRASDDPLVRRCHVDMFVMPPTLEELRRRLGDRATDDEATIQLRLVNAQNEIRHWPTYQYTLVSGTREQDYQRFEAVLLAERQRSSRLTDPSSGPPADAAGEIQLELDGRAGL